MRQVAVCTPTVRDRGRRLFQCNRFLTAFEMTISRDFWADHVEMWFFNPQNPSTASHWLYFLYL